MNILKKLFTVVTIKKFHIAVPIASFIAIGLMLLANWLTNYFYWLETGKMYANAVLK